MRPSASEAFLSGKRPASGVTTVPWIGIRGSCEMNVAFPLAQLAQPPLYLVRTSAGPIFGHVAIGAEDLESGRVVVQPKPPVEERPATCPAGVLTRIDLLAVCVAPAVDMVDLEERLFGLPAAGAGAAISGQCQLPVEPTPSVPGGCTPLGVVRPSAITHGALPRGSAHPLSVLCVAVPTRHGRNPPSAAANGHWPSGGAL